MRTLIILVSALLAACGGGGGSSPAAIAPPLPAPALAIDPAGVWAGKIAGDLFNDDVICRLDSGPTESEVNCLIFSGPVIQAAAATDLGTFSVAGTWSGSGLLRWRSDQFQFDVVGGQAQQLASGARELELLVRVATSEHTISAQWAETPIAAAIGTYSEELRGMSFSIDANGAIYSQGGTCVIEGASNGHSWGKRLVDVCASNCGAPSGNYRGFGLTVPASLYDAASPYETVFAYAVFFVPNSVVPCTGPGTPAPGVAYWLSSLALK